MRCFDADLAGFFALSNKYRKSTTRDKILFEISHNNFGGRYIYYRLC